MTCRRCLTPVRAALLLLVAALMCWPTASAHADAFTGEGDQQLTTQPPKTSGGGATTMSTPANGTFYCSVPYAAVQAAPSGFVVGNCPQGTELRRRVKSALVDVGQGQFDYYEGGYIFGQFSGCGWVRTAQSTAYNTTDVWNNCDPNSIGYNMDEFIYRFSNGQYYTDGCSGASSCAGTLINNRTDCWTVANVRPWTSGQSVPSAIRIIPANATHLGQSRLAWRYVTKYPTTDGSYWVMARDRAYGSGQGNWVFVPLSCL